MGVVYEAWDEGLQRPIALKLIRADRFDDDHAEARFEREALALAKLAHPNVVTIHEIGEHREQLFIVMELVRGETLSAWCDRGSRSWEECLDVYVQAGRGLSAAHEAGVIHRDFKPANCIVGERGRVRVLDFGLARGLSDAVGDDEATVSKDGGRSLDVMVTKTGALVGTPAYMAPEQLKREHVDAASDQFAFCVSFYEALIGVRPFAGVSMFELCTNIRHGTFRTNEQGPSMSPPAALLEILRRGLHNDAERRWPSMGALVEALERFPSRRRQRRAAWGAAGLLTAGLGIGVVWAEPEPCSDLHATDVWSASRQESVRQSVLVENDGERLGEASWRSLNDATTQWRDRWGTIRLDACERALVTKETTQTTYARQVACLERHAQTVGTLVDGLAADPLAWEHATDVVRLLPDLSPCASAEAVLQVEPPPAAIVPAVDEVRATLDAALAQWTRADADASRRLHDEAWALAKDLGYAAVRAEVGLRRGRTGLHASDQSSAEILADALADAELAGDDLTAADIVTELVVVATHQNQIQAGVRWRKLARAKIVRANAGPHQDARLALHAAELAMTAGDLEGAEQDVRRGLELYDALAGKQSLWYADALAIHTQVLERKGAREEAAGVHDQTLSVLAHILGSKHPRVGLALLNRGLFRFGGGDDQGAAEDFNAALTILERTKTQPRSVATARMARAQLLSMSGELDLAAVEAAAAPLENLPEDDVARLNAAAWKAAFMLRLGHAEAALAEYEELIAVHLRQPEHLVDEVAMLRSNAGECLVALERWSQARARFDEAVKALDTVVAANDPRLAYPLAGLGEVALQEGRPAESAKAFERALPLAVANPGDALNLAKVRWGLARARFKTSGRSPRTVKLARDAADGFRELGDEGHRQVDDIEAWLNTHFG